MTSLTLRLPLAAVGATLVAAAGALAQPESGPDYEITWETIDGGGNTAAGGDYSLSGTIGQPDVGPALVNAPFVLAGGYWGSAIVPTCPPDFNGDNDFDPDDLSDFITCFFSQVQMPGTCPLADFNADTNVDPDDLADFITCFFS